MNWKEKEKQHLSRCVRPALSREKRSESIAVQTVADNTAVQCMPVTQQLHKTEADKDRHQMRSHTQYDTLYSVSRYQDIQPCTVQRSEYNQCTMRLRCTPAALMLQLISHIYADTALESLNPVFHSRGVHFFLSLYFFSFFKFHCQVIYGFLFLIKTIKLHCGNTLRPSLT